MRKKYASNDKDRLLVENFKKFMEEGDFSPNLNEEESQKSLFVLVGPPSVGKSTWMKKAFAGKSPYVINRDDIAASVAKSEGWTYDDMFVSPPKDAQEGDVDEKYGTVVKSPAYMTWQPLSYDKVVEANGKIHDLFTKRVAGAQPSGKDIVVDMTNMNARARKGAQAAIKSEAEGDYKKIAVVFKFEGAEEIIKKVAAKRAKEANERGESKTIPPEAFDRMFKAFQEVDPSEGFDEVISVDNIAALRSLVGD
jgi:hypothetical protein